MKNLLLTFSFIVTSFLSLSAQITINQSDLPTVGLVQYRVEADTLINYAGDAGENQTWDFTFLDTLTIDTVVYTSPEGTLGAENYPMSNLAIGSAADSSYQYFESTAEAFYLLGLTAINEGDTINVPFSPKSKLVSLPSTFGTVNHDSTNFVIEVNTQFGLVRLKSKQISESVVDGYGTLITGDGSFKALRQTTQTQTIDSTWIDLGGGSFFLFDASTSQSSQIAYISRESKGLHISISMAEDGHIDGVDYLINLSPIIDAPTAGFDIDNQGEGVVVFANTSTESPTSYLWDFGDGTTSSEVNPTHTYTQNGTYHVCLTATNAGGENTICKDVVILLSPVASFTSEVTGNGELTFTDQSSNDPTDWSWDFGDDSTSTEQNPVHTFAASGEYNVCLTASNAAGDDTTCETISVVIIATNDPIDNFPLLVYPNPSKDFVHFEIIDGRVRTVQLEITNSIGQVIRQDLIQSVKTIDVSKLPSGMYHYRISTTKGAVLKMGEILVL